MKKMVLVLLIMLVAVTASLFAEMTAFEKVNYNLEFSGINDDTLKIVKNLSDKLTLEEKIMIKNRYGSNAVVPFLLNFFIGFGSGSYLQGDIAFAIPQTVLDIVGWGLLIKGIVGEFLDGAGIYGIIGACLYGASKIMSIVTPWVYSSKVNNKLETALGIKSLAFTPFINKNNDFGFVASIKL